MTLMEHPEYWRSVAAQERAAGNDRLADDYERMATVAASLNALLIHADAQAEALAATARAEVG